MRRAGGAGAATIDGYEPELTEAEAAVAKAEAAVAGIEAAVAKAEAAVAKVEAAVAMTELAITGADRAIAAIDRAIADTDRAIAFIDRAIVVTERAIAVTDRAIAKAGVGGVGVSFTDHGHAPPAVARHLFRNRQGIRDRRPWGAARSALALHSCPFVKFVVLNPKGFLTTDFHGCSRMTKTEEFWAPRITRILRILGRELKTLPLARLHSSRFARFARFAVPFPLLHQLSTLNHQLQTSPPSAFLLALARGAAENPNRVRRLAFPAGPLSNDDSLTPDEFPARPPDPHGAGRRD